MSDTQGIDAPNCAHKQLKKQMVGEFVYYVCECGQKFRAWDGKVSVLAPPDPRKDPAAPVLAQSFHEAYERLAPQFGYETRKESAVAWADVPERNRKLMIAVCAELLAEMRGAKRGSE